VSLTYGTGLKWGSALVKLQRDRTVMLNAFHMYSDGWLHVPFSYMHSQPPFGASRESRDELRRRIREAVPEAAIPAEEERENPSLSLDQMADESVRAAFVAAFEWAFEQVRNAQLGTGTG
jgi:hypothetical protein